MSIYLTVDQHFVTVSLCDICIDHHTLEAVDTHQITTTVRQQPTVTCLQCHLTAITEFECVTRRQIHITALSHLTPTIQNSFHLLRITCIARQQSHQQSLRLLSITSIISSLHLLSIGSHEISNIASIHCCYDTQSERVDIIVHSIHHLEDLTRMLHIMRHDLSSSVSNSVLVTLCRIHRRSLQQIGHDILRICQCCEHMLHFVYCHRLTGYRQDMYTIVVIREVANRVCELIAKLVVHKASSHCEQGCLIVQRESHSIHI